MKLEKFIQSPGKGKTKVIIKLKKLVPAILKFSNKSNLIKFNA